MAYERRGVLKFSNIAIQNLKKCVRYRDAKSGRRAHSCGRILYRATTEGDELSCGHYSLHGPPERGPFLAHTLLAALTNSLSSGEE